MTNTTGSPEHDDAATPAAEVEPTAPESPSAAEPAPTPEAAAAEEPSEASPEVPSEPASEPASAEAAAEAGAESHAEAEDAPAEPAPVPTPADVAPAPTPAEVAPAPAAPVPAAASAEREPEPAAASPEPADAAPAPAGPAAPTVASNEWGRVDETGEVFVRTAEGERSIGSWQVGKPEEALAFFVRKYEDLAVQVDLLETRLESGAAAPDDTAQGVSKVRAQLAEAHAIGDLAALGARLDALDARIAERRAERRAARAKALDEARGRKEQIASQAEAIAEGNDWRNGADTLRGLLEEWKGLPRLDRGTDDELWRRFSSARTHYTRRRKAHFSELAERRDEARVIKERILAEAEEICTSTDWGPTSRRYRELMSQWKAAGPAPRGVEDSLWKRFRAAQDTFFGARTAHQSQRDDEQQANLVVKEGILTEAEALLPVTDWKAARQQLRVLQERWEDAGHVPRDSMRSVEGRMRRVEDAIREAEQNEWQRSNPEARARAQATVTQLEASIADLETKAAKAREAGNDRKLREAEEAIAARKSWLEQAQQALEEFTS
ncbi:DUF349 domain-containing protein [Jiangella sp. DSM 45060]|uniref:DUF349 domain-containing protein n=1 Tax=Jiangella sp. DSM 45060 TaxID=1798224 RepID=UPI00087B148B|nr:DUF349 domain-containing protein [Jiangella sp. DSM 45060]SDT05449.1 protein of unknown function [Jiangella sp. DSM 45060]